MLTVANHLQGIETLAIVSPIRGHREGFDHVVFQLALEFDHSIGSSSARRWRFMVPKRLWPSKRPGQAIVKRDDDERHRG